MRCKASFAAKVGVYRLRRFGQWVLDVRVGGDARALSFQLSASWGRRTVPTWVRMIARALRADPPRSAAAREDVKEPHDRKIVCKRRDPYRSGRAGALACP